MYARGSPSALHTTRGSVLSRLYLFDSKPLCFFFSTVQSYSHFSCYGWWEPSHNIVTLVRKYCWDTGITNCVSLFYCFLLQTLCKQSSPALSFPFPLPLIRMSPASVVSNFSSTSTDSSTSLKYLKKSMILSLSLSLSPLNICIFLFFSPPQCGSKKKRKQSSHPDNKSSNGC